MAKVLIFDTSILCVWLQIPGKEICGSDEDPWNHDRVKEIIDKERKANTTFILPLAAIIETGNHIAQAQSQRYEKAQELAKLMILAADQTTPWAAFTEQSVFWQADGLKKLAEVWPPLANQRLAMGDATIKDIAEYYHRLKMEVEILTGDQGLKSYEPTQQQTQNTSYSQRRRRNRS
ncbi:hypothetical protein [Crocosphaera sp. XPORK-15E]|uniref:hypothetical protein n=1 Tax=Crocosphaera sp. XPORK-15E TaxID=3110247 RepID=UPI002B21225C|nr:hypothetical protein [Crocosphaera sp. XPORK-15E]MEA5535995.1 hypothetical protein [Crocosphaera sp. XPORK-15E]